MSEFRQVQKGRGLQGIVTTIIAITLGIVFVIQGDLLFVVFGLALFVLSIGGIYAIWTNADWVLEIASNAVCWSYPRWPRSSGSIPIGELIHVVIDDASNALTLTLKNGETKKIKLWNSGIALRQHLATSYPNLAVEYIEARHST